MPANNQPADEMPPFEYHAGRSPLVIAAPHVGTHLPPAIAAAMTPTGLKAGETDHHVHRLFDFARALDATTLWATHSRYVVDLNRDPESRPLYPGRFETPLCPLSDFDRNPLYRQGHEPDGAEIARRRDLYWRPYHAQLRAALDAARDRHGHALLIDAHSIRPEIPSLFEGRLPDLNFGMNDGQTAGPALQAVVRNWAENQDLWSFVIDGRFKGGYTTRHYGRPADGLHAVQIEIVQDRYLNMAAPHLYDTATAAPLSRALRPLVEQLLAAL
jgi:N-formylglutamate deformylase